jgi:hypothetical protein
LDKAGFSPSWFSDVSTAFRNTSVGDALDSENLKSDWRVVAVRIVPCQSLLNRPHGLGARVCWPEVRLVLQPIAKNVEAAGRRWPAFADDRAIHVLYHYAAPGQEYPSAQVERLKESAHRMPSAALEASPDWAGELAAFEASRDRSVVRLVDSVLALRDPGVVVSDLDVVELRPEYALGATERTAFTGRLMGFLEGVQRSSALPHEVTAFSLPEGREPVLIDEWVFLRFVASSNGRLVQSPIEVRSVTDGTTLLSTAQSMSVTMARDDDVVYEAMESLVGSAYEEEFKRNMILFIPDIAANRLRIADDGQVRVANTTCGSCHKLGKLRFDLHNLSYLQGETMTISPRVVRDVLRDLRWLAAWRP